MSANLYALMSYGLTAAALYSKETPKEDFQTKAQKEIKIL